LNTEDRYITVGERNQRHVVAAVRHRDDYGVITHHTYHRIALCGAEVEEALPYFPVTIEDSCPACMDAYHDSLSPAVIPSTIRETRHV